MASFSRVSSISRSFIGIGWTVAKTLILLALNNVAERLLLVPEFCTVRPNWLRYTKSVVVGFIDFY